MNENESRYEIVFAGVGGQGILTITDIICNSAVWEGWRIRGSETHGMAQRGGSIVSNIRLGKGYSGFPWSALIAEREAELVISLEPSEALRYARFVKPEGTIVTSTWPVAPPSMTIKKTEYPPINEVLQALGDYAAHIITLDALELAKKAGIARSLNIVILGAASAVPGFPLSEEILFKAIEYQLPPKTHELNKQAFQLGKEAALQQLK
ncbi:MAG: indolepyruvate oxidoreductase subunit beta [Candidatus Hodarchaeota archaeon]